MQFKFKIDNFIFQEHKLSEDIRKKISNHICKEILRQPNRDLDPTTPIISSGLVDSFNLVDLALFIEDEFGVHIDDSELNAEFFDTVAQLVEIIESRMNN